MWEYVKLKFTEKDFVGSRFGKLHQLHSLFTAAEDHLVSLAKLHGLSAVGTNGDGTALTAAMLDGKDGIGRKDHMVRPSQKIGRNGLYAKEVKIPVTHGTPCGEGVARGACGGMEDHPVGTEIAQLFLPCKKRPFLKTGVGHLVFSGHFTYHEIRTL